MEKTVKGPTLNARGGIIFVITLAALFSHWFETGSAAHGQTESSAAVEAPVLAAAYSGTDTVALSWNPVSGAVAYELWAWDSAGHWQRLDDGKLTATTHTHSGLSPGTTFHYTIRATDADGNSGAWSEYAIATVSESQISLSAPMLTAQAAAGQVNLEWEAVEGAVLYEVLAWRSSASGWQQIDDGNLTETSYTHEGLEPGTEYYYTVRAVDINGASGAWSEYARATVLKTELPALTSTPTSSPSSASPLTATPSPTPTPTQYSTDTLSEANTTTPTPTPTESALEAPTLAAEAGAGQITLTWGEVVNADRYELLVWLDLATGWQRLDEGNLTGMTYAHKGVEAGTTYYYAIRSVDDSGETSEWSAYAKATVTEVVEQESTATPTLTPTSTSGLTQTPTPTPTVSAVISPTLAAEAGAGQITLTWKEVVSALRYELLAWRDLATGWQRLDDGNLTGTTFAHKRLAAGTKYYYAMRAIDAHGDSSPWSEYANATVLASSRLPEPAKERAALAALYNSTDGANWVNSDNWVTDEPISTWFGVTANENGNVTQLVLNRKQLRGPIPDLSALSELTVLKLGYNELTGPIPDLSALSNLKDLYLENNQLHGEIPDLSALTDLISLRLGANQLSGPVPDLSALTKLTFLGLGSNQLTGPVQGLSALTNLAYLHIGSNQFSESQSDLNALSGLRWLNLSDGHFTGQMPDLSALTSLRYIDLSHNQLTGSIPSLSSYSNLKALDLGFNQFTGAIPDLSALGNMQNLNFESNQLTGPIPDLSGLTNMQYLDFGSNQLTGSIPNLNALTGLEDLSLDNNQLSGVIPDLSALRQLTSLTLGYNQLTGIVPSLGALTNLEFLGLQSNNLVGLSSGAFRELSSLRVLLLYGNSLSSLPATVFDGLTNLQHLRADDNLLEGLPSGIFDSLVNLQVLEMHDNRIGILPASVFDSLASLTWLNLRGNQLTGPIPDLRMLKRLIWLDLSGNMLCLPENAGLSGLNEVVAAYVESLSLPVCSG